MRCELEHENQYFTTSTNLLSVLWRDGLRLILSKTVFLLKTNSSPLNLQIFYVSLMIHKRKGDKMLFT